MALRPNSELWNYFTNNVEEGLAECKLCRHRLKNNRSYNLKLHLRNVHKNTKEIDKYFHISFLENLAVCKICKHRLKNRLCNLRLHMRRTHNIEVIRPDTKLTDNLSSPQPYDEDQINAVLKIAKRKMIQHFANSVKRPARWLYIQMDKKTIKRGAIGLVVEDGVSPQLFRSKHIEAILGPMCKAISSKESEEFKVDEPEIVGLISSIASYIRNDFSNELHCRLLSIKIDSDIDASPNTFCITAQFLNEGEKQQRILGVIDLDNDCQLNENHIKQVLYKFNIDSNQIISAFGSNTKYKHSKQVQNSEYLREAEQFEFCPDILLGEAKVEPYLGTKAQLCLLDIFKNPKIFQPFLQCRNLAKFISDKSNSYRELFTLNNITIPQLDSPWEPGSTYQMMSTLHGARNLLKNVHFGVLEHPEDQFSLTERLWSFIEAFCKSTIYLQKTILKCFSEELHIGDFYAQWLKCKILTKKLLSDSNKKYDFISTILAEVLEALDNRTKELFHQDRLTACLYLDPRFQQVLNPTQKTNAVEYLKKLWLRAKLYIVDDSESNKAARLCEHDEDAIINEFLSNDIEVNNKGSSDVLNKIEGLKLVFQTVDKKILLFWKAQEKSDPELHTLSTICFAIPATEIYHKRRYSHVYRLEAKSELPAFTKENLLTLRLNAHLLDEALVHLQLTNDERSSVSGTEAECNDISEGEHSNTGSTMTALSELMATSTTVTFKPSSTMVSSDELPADEFI